MHLKTFYIFSCLSLSANVQTFYTDHVVNGDCEGDDVSCFASHEYVYGERFESKTRLIIDLTNEDNHYAMVSYWNQAKA